MSDAHTAGHGLPDTITPDPCAPPYRANPASRFRVKFDARVDFTNGGHAAVEGFLLDIEGDSVTPPRLAEMIVSAMNLLRAGPVTITRMEVVARGAHDDAEAAPPETLASPEAVREAYGAPRVLAAAKTRDRLDAWSRKFLALSPFCVIASADARGWCDATPRGDGPGFVRVLDDVTVAIPDRLGNNRVDTLLNVASNPRVGLLFLIPGVRETMRINGRAVISTEPQLREGMRERGKAPASVLVITVEELFFHCGKALIRSELWNPGKHVPPGTIPPIGRMVAEQLGTVDPAQAEADTLAAYVERLY
ncbi:MSMEG_1061 family FMN-dependent PPOX-type flavoprotein [Elioraea sp.]|uniref:MSMEG_1061 family FMN-dependent PPOX-type flavoprotein n=1 Tax=Elioraea sp. TaxID=2185103 RepID=UPI0025BF4777|nr:MSMEG_1061 family FMN-dependent PPOX-type flavoprotein [Elioraea sp.]